MTDEEFDVKWHKVLDSWKSEMADRSKNTNLKDVFKNIDTNEKLVQAITNYNGLSNSVLVHAALKEFLN